MSRPGLKAKCMASATLPDTWPKPVFAFKGSVGHLPVEAQPYVFASRRNAKTGRHTVVPDMLYPIPANRQPVPRHEVLEDEYRAFHGVLKNQTILMKNYMPNFDSHSEEKRSLSLVRQPVMDFNSAVWSGRINKNNVEKMPRLLAYHHTINPPPGYIYRKYRNLVPHRNASTSRVASRRGALRCPPMVNIQGPFQNVVSLCATQPLPDTRRFDSGVIEGGPSLGEVRIYNEPDAISDLVTSADFDIRLPDRARRGYKPVAEASASGQK